MFLITRKARSAEPERISLLPSNFRLPKLLGPLNSNIGAAPEEEVT